MARINRADTTPAACRRCSCTRLYVPLVSRCGRRLSVTIGIPGVNRNFRLSVVIPTGVLAQLPAKEQDDPDHERDGDDQWWGQSREIGEHAGSFPPSARCTI